MKRKKSIVTEVVPYKRRKLNKNYSLIRGLKRNNLIFRNIGYDKFPRKLPKFISYDINATVKNSNPYIALINGLQLGNSNQTRIGGECLMKSVEYKFICHPLYRPGANSSANAGSTFAITVVYDNSPTGTLPGVSTGTQAIFNGNYPHDLPLFDMSDRYTILLNEIYEPKNISEYTNQSVGTTTIFQVDFSTTGERYRKFALRSKFNANDVGDITDFNTGAMYLIIRSDSLTGSGFDNSILVDIDVRVRFVDV